MMDDPRDDHGGCWEDDGQPWPHTAWSWVGFCIITGLGLTALIGWAVLLGVV